jgi:3-oxoacyl-[acyl-carrier protein] reductase
MSKKFEDWQFGDSAEFIHKISADDVRKFVELTGDDNMLHVDKHFAEKTPFKGIVTHGMLSASFVSTMIGKYIPGNGALWVSQSFEFLLPVRIGDELCIFSRIIEKHESQRLLVLETKITNQHKQLVLTGLGKVKVLQTEILSTLPETTEKRNVVIITGASKGIGAATARLLGSKGYQVIVNYAQDRDAAESVVNDIYQKGGTAFACQADVRDIHAVKKMVLATVNKFGTISGLVHCATSKIVARDFRDVEWREIQQHLDIQLQGAFNCIQAVLGQFCEAKRGSVVIIGSVATDNVPPAKWAGYTLSKAALHSLTKSLALEYGMLGVRFNTVSPGMTDTALIADIPEKARLLARMQSPLRKLAQPIDIANSIAFLLSDEAGHITGENLRVCGGSVML